MAIALTSWMAWAGQVRSGGGTQLPLFPVRIAWTIALGNDLAGAPSFNRGRGYFPLTDNKLAAYDLDRGVLAWTAEVSRGSGATSGGGLVYLHEVDAITARRESDGAMSWRTPFGEALASPLVWDNGWLVAATESGAVLAFRALDGELIWRREIGTPVNAPPALAADRVYIPTRDRRVIALRVETGDPLWERRVGGPPHELLALDDRIYFGSDDNYFYCLLATTGHVDWRWSAGADVIGLAAYDRDRVYFVALDNVLRAVHRRTGNQVWKRPLPLRPASGPLLAADTLVVRGVGPVVRAFLRSTGAPAGELTTPHVMGPPHVVNPSALAIVIVMTRDFEHGTMVTALTRSIEPALAPVAPLPNPILPAVPK